MPKITVGMPVYNGEKYVEESIRSVLAQTYDDFVFFIADNGSTDASSEICRDYMAKDARIQYWRNENNIGAAANYNALFARAETRYFRWSNADDLLDPTLHEKCLNVLESDSESVLAAGATIFIDSNGNEMSRYDDNLHIVHESARRRLSAFLDQVGLTNVIYGLMRTDALARTDLMGDGTVPAADTIMMGQLVLQGKFQILDEALFYRRMHAESSSADRASNELQESFWSAGDKKFNRPTWRRIAAYMRGISNASLATAETIAIYKLILHQAWSMKRDLVSEIIWPR